MISNQKASDILFISRNLIDNGNYQVLVETENQVLELFRAADGLTATTHLVVAHLVVTLDLLVEEVLVEVEQQEVGSELNHKISTFAY